MIDKRHIVNLKNKDYVVWAGVLDAAHKSGLISIEVNLLQYPTKENGNLAIAQATATFEGGRLFSEVGDASPANVGTMIAPHLCRMAATRAKGRALRDALNIGEALLEELGPDAEAHNGQQQRVPPEGRVMEARTAAQRARRDPEDEASHDDPNDPLCEWPDCPRRVTAEQAARSQEHFAKTLCANHDAQLAAVRSRKGAKAEVETVTV